ncbi:protein POF1B isoform X2 [Thalassophryne amazonica]|uniref:protein POF1B isoform X2 n=1 Tax=Thalassophryne amazonica TaxID=390379 RepID=UPI00147131A0|nr:protein POF1B isoform X2 [Thalassophryne amazonica]
MSVETNRKTTTTRTYRTVNVAPSEPVSGTTTRTYRTVNVAPAETVSGGTVISARTVSPLPYTMNGSYETVRYLVPVQQAVQQQQSYVLMPQTVVSPQVVSPVYLQSVPRLSVSSQESDVYQQHSALESYSRKSSSVFSQSSSPIKSPEPSAEEEVEEIEELVEEQEEEEEGVEVEEEEFVTIIQNKSPVVQKISRTEFKTETKEVPQPTKMDTRYFGELLAEVYRKNCDIHSCISEHVSKIRGKKHQLDSNNDYKVEKEEVEALIPKGATELTKQQIRYLLQTRLTADKSMRLLLSTFSSLRDELLHMSEDLRRLESEKESLERDLSFKADQARQYDSLLEAVRENNRQLQLSLKESSSAQRSLESQLMNSRSSDSSRDFTIKEMEGRMRVLEKENEMLRQKLAGQSSSATLQIKTQELSRQYSQQLSAMQQEKDREIQKLRSQITRIQTEVTTGRSSSEQSLQLKISELLSMLEQRQATITRQEQEIKRLMQERSDSSSNITKTIITKRYRNQYPILGLLSDDYPRHSPIKETRPSLSKEWSADQTGMIDR